VAIINSSRLFVLGNHFDLQGNPFFLKISACDIIYSKIKQILSTRLCTSNYGHIIKLNKQHNKTMI
jgi:hypothetical protein